MLWQIAAAAAIGTLFYVRRVALWIRSHFDLRSKRSAGFLFASCYALVVSPIICKVFPNLPLPRFADIFLVGIVLTAYLFTWEAAVYLLGISLAVSAWVLPPYGSFTVSNGADLYRLGSFSCLAVFLVTVVHRLKAGRRAVPQVDTAPAPMLRSRSMAAGD